MLSIEKCKKILAQNGKQCTDKEVKRIREILYQIGHLDYYLFTQIKRTMPNAIIYTTVSTDEQADKGYSLRAKRTGWKSIFHQRHKHYCSDQDDHSAKTFDRPEFAKLLDFAKKNKSQVDHFIVVK